MNNRASLPADLFSRGTIIGLDNPITDLIYEMITRCAKNMIIRPNTSTSFLIGRGNIHKNPILLSAEEIREDMAALGINVMTDDSFHMLYKSEQLPEVYRINFIIACYGQGDTFSITVRNVESFDVKDLPAGATL